LVLVLGGGGVVCYSFSLVVLVLLVRCRVTSECPLSSCANDSRFARRRVGSTSRRPPSVPEHVNQSSKRRRTQSKALKRRQCAKV
jgi:hypothetical protein